MPWPSPWKATRGTPSGGLTPRRSGTAEGVLADGSTAASWIAVLDAYTCRRGPEQMRVDAELALAQLAPGSPWRSSVVFLDAMSYFLRGDA